MSGGICFKYSTMHVKGRDFMTRSSVVGLIACVQKTYSSWYRQTKLQHRDLESSYLSGTELLIEILLSCIIHSLTEPV